MSQRFNADQPATNRRDLDERIDRLAIRDYLLLGAYCLILYGVSLISGRELTIHEAVLPQSARSMLADSDWVVPKKGNAPWLESPPLPQWCTVTIASVIGRCDEVWIVRIGPAVMATAVVVSPIPSLPLDLAAGATFGPLLGTIYGGDGRTTFGLPDMREKDRALKKAAGLKEDSNQLFHMLSIYGIYPSRF